MKILSFAITGSFAAFRDPTVTSNQNVYYIPSKSAIVGILGAMIGVPRSSALGEMYGQEYYDLFSTTRIGIALENEPTKITLFTNHRSLKEAKTKPFKSELLEGPKYRIYVSSTDDTLRKLKDVITGKKFVYSPYLGHAYCPATISELEEHDGNETDQRDRDTRCVILDESETYRDDFTITVKPARGQVNSKIIIERHLHHYVKDGKMERIVLKHWIPVNTKYEIERLSKPELSNLVEINNDVVCMY